MHANGENPLADISAAIAKRCGARMLSVSVGEAEPHLEDASKSKHVVSVSMPPLEGTSEYRKQLMAEHGMLRHHCIHAILLMIS